MGLNCDMAPAQNPLSFSMTPNAPLCLFDDRSVYNDLKPSKRFEILESSGKSFNLELPPTNGKPINAYSLRLAWDAENRLLQITYPGSGNNTQFTYDPLGRCVKIVETVASSVTSTKQFVWCGAQRCEERDGSGSLSNGKQFFPLGQVNFASGTPTNYFYTQDHPGSIREMTKTVSGTTTIEAQYAYDPYGIVTKLQGSQDADFQYAGYYMHAPSGLNLPVYRAYSSSLGRFINRDPIGENGGINLYGYVENNPISNVDLMGTVPKKAMDSVRAAILKDIASGNLNEANMIIAEASAAGILTPQDAAAYQNMMKGVTPSNLDGSFCIIDNSFKAANGAMRGYPSGNIPFPDGPFRFLGKEAQAAMREIGNYVNRGLNSGGQPTHEIQPINWGGSATDFANKAGMMSRQLHDQYTGYWNSFKNYMRSNNIMLP